MAQKHLSKSVATKLAQQELSRIANRMPGIWIEHAPIHSERQEPSHNRSAFLWAGVITTSIIIFGLWIINMTAMFSDRSQMAGQNTNPIEAAGADLFTLFKKVETSEGLTIRDAGKAVTESLEHRTKIKQTLKEAILASPAVARFP